MDPKLKKCETCQIDATCIWYQCISYLCDSCFKLIHNNEIRKDHKKDKIDYYALIETKCHQHKLHPMDLYCVFDKGIYNLKF